MSTWMERTARILIVEDEGILAEALKAQLGQLGYEVAAIVGTGTDAVQAALIEDLDLVMMDIMLRGEMDGIEAAREIRKKHRIPVIYMTGFTNTRAFRLIKRLYPSCYLAKPFSLADLKRVVERALDS